MTTMNSKPKLAIRMVARYEGSAWAKLSQKKVFDLIHGTASEPEWADETVEIVFAYILADAKPRRLSHISASTWTFDQHGRVDDQQEMKTILQQLDEPPPKLGQNESRQINEVELVEICRLLKVRPPG